MMPHTFSSGPCRTEEREVPVPTVSAWAGRCFSALGFLKGVEGQERTVWQLLEAPSNVLAQS